MLAADTGPADKKQLCVFRGAKYRQPLGQLFDEHPIRLTVGKAGPLDQNRLPAESRQVGKTNESPF
jgi:hypothetical protein